MSVGDTGPALHAYCPAPADRAALEAALSSALEAAGLSAGSWARARAESRCVGTRGLARFPVAFEISPRSTQLVLSRLHGQEVRELGATGVFDLFFRLCEAAQAQLGRSDGGAGLELVQESELAGAIRRLGWFNFYGPEIAAAHRHDLVSAPWVRSQWTASGAFGGAAWSEPMGDWHHHTDVARMLALPWASLSWPDATKPA